MSVQGFRRLLQGRPWFRGEGSFPFPAYSEFMPPPRLGPRPYGDGEPLPCVNADPHGWQITEHEEESELAPGMAQIAREVVHALEHLGEGRPAHGIARSKLEDNPYWPVELSARAGSLKHEAYVTLAPVALSRTQDDKGRVRWTLFGGSEQGPARGFWKGFFHAPGIERPDSWGRGFFARLIAAAYAEPLATAADLRRLGFRILAGDRAILPKWTREFGLRDGEPIARVRYLLTFEPFAALPAAVRRAYLDGRLHLLPFPGSLLFYGAAPYRRLREQLPFAMQIPLLQVCMRHEGLHGIRIPQSGYLHEPHPAMPHPAAHHGQIRNGYRRTHRFARHHRHDDELLVTGREDRLAHVLFSERGDDLELYGKPMARNAQIWTDGYALLLDGPSARRAEIKKAAEALRQGGVYGYRFVFPAMRVGRHELYWHRPLVSYKRRGGAVGLVDDPPLGYLTAYRADNPVLESPVELWPRPLAREHHVHAARLFPRGADRREHLAAMNRRKVLDAARLLGRPLPRRFARQLLTAPKEMTLDAWLSSIEHAGNPALGRAIVAELKGHLEKDEPAAPDALTYGRTATRAFEKDYWRCIALLSTRFMNKENADCAKDAHTRAALKRHHRELEALGDYLIAHYRRAAARARMSKRVLVGDIPFKWETECELKWSGGWLAGEEGRGEERNIIAVIPGRDRARAVVFADHYDTAYMEDRYDPPQGNRSRLAAAGADDNHSATAALMLAAPILMDLSRAGKLACDIWLVHLTGEEFPSDCLGARHLARSLVEGTLSARIDGRRFRDLSKTRVEGVYVADMIAHNHDRDRDVFMIAPGAGAGSLKLAMAAQQATAAWNARIDKWNARPGRRDAGRGVRSADPKVIPAEARHPLLHGEVRPPSDPRSALFNTDGQVLSDAGVPVVLFMENYDISRRGYHDTHDTMENIDLDFGAAVAAVAIESVARVAAGMDG